MHNRTVLLKILVVFSFFFYFSAFSEVYADTSGCVSTNGHHECGTGSWSCTGSPGSYHLIANTDPNPCDWCTETDGQCHWEEDYEGPTETCNTCPGVGNPAPVRSSECVGFNFGAGDNVNPTASPGQTLNGTITWRNTGQRTWNGGGLNRPYFMAPNSNTINWGWPSIPPTIPWDCEPGSSCTYPASITAPSNPTASSYSAYFQMGRLQCNGEDPRVCSSIHDWFGVLCGPVVNMNVPNNAPNVTLTGQDVTRVPSLNLPQNTLTSVYEGDILRLNTSATDSNNNLSNLRLILWGDDGVPPVDISPTDLVVPAPSCAGACSSLSTSYDFNTTAYGSKYLYFYAVARDQLGLEGLTGVIQVFVRPYTQISGILYDAPNIGVCSASSPAILNSGASISAYSGAVQVAPSGVVQSDGSYVISRITNGTSVTSMCVSIPAPPSGEYRLSCANSENAYPQPTCYTLSTPLDMSVNRTANIGLRKVEQEPWFTSLYSDVYGGNGISQTVPTPPTSSAVSGFTGYLGDWAAGSINGSRSYSFTASGGTLNVNGTGRSGRIYRIMAGGLPSDRRGGFAMRMPYAADKMWPAAYINLTLPANVPVTLVNDKGILNTLDPSEVRVYRITNPTLFDAAGTTYNLRNLGVAVLYYTGNVPLRIDGSLTHSSGAAGVNERLLIVSTIAPIEIGSFVGTAVPTTSTLPQIQAGLITTATGANNVIRYLSNGGTDRSIVVEGPVISKTVDMQRNLGFVNNEAYPTNVYVYNYNYLYQLTRAERNSLDVPNYTGLSVVDINWTWVN